MTTKQALGPGPGYKLLDSIHRVSHAQRSQALTTIMGSLIDLGFYEDEPISGGDAVEEVARAYNLVTERILSPGWVLEVAVPGEPDDLLSKCTDYLRDIREKTLDGSEDELGDLVKKTLKYEMEVHVSAGSEAQVRSETITLLMGLFELGFYKDEPINGGDAVESLAELYAAAAKTVFGGMKLSESEAPAMTLLEDCRQYLQDIHAEDHDGSEPALDELLVEVAAYVGPAPLDGTQRDQLWMEAVANITPALVGSDLKDLAHKATTLEIANLPGRQLNALMAHCLRHNPLTGHHTDSLGALACRLERNIRIDAAKDLTRMLGAERTDDQAAQAAKDLEPKWHLFKVQATGGDDVSGDLVANFLVSALSGSRSIAEALARAAVDDATPESYFATHSEFVCESDRDVWMLVSSDVPLEGFDDSDRPDRTERQRG
jgi:hypothetical protein